MNEEKRYSPSAVKTWDRCPMLWELERTGWRPRTFGKKEIAAAMGRGVAAALAVHYHYRDEIALDIPLPMPLPDPRLAACAKAYDAEIAQLEGVGITCENRSVELLGQARPKALRTVQRFLDRDPIPPEWTIEDVELTFPEHGYARLDPAVRDPHRLALIDWKVKLTLAKGYQRDRFIQEQENMQSMLHYAWAYSDVKKEPVTRYYIGLIVIEPTFSVTLLPYEIEPEVQAAWLISTRQAWQDMDKQATGDRVPRQSAVHFDRYGQCPMSDACFKYRYHEHLMTEGYVNIKRTREVES